MSRRNGMPDVRGKLTPNAPLAPLVWFKSGGSAEWLFEPKDEDDLTSFLSAISIRTCRSWRSGLGSNMIVRDGGVPGVVVRLGKAFAKIEKLDDVTLRCGGGASGILVSPRPRATPASPDWNSCAASRDGRRLRPHERRRLRPRGAGHSRRGPRRPARRTVETWPLEQLGYTYRHSEVPEGAVVVEATFRGTPGKPEAIGAEMDAIARAREESQPLRSRTGGSTFKNPPAHKAWALVDAAGCRGLTMGDAQVSEKHCNFLLNLGSATSADIEALGEEVRRRVLETSGITLEWEIQRIGRE